jgi:hypothetical protein
MEWHFLDVSLPLPACTPQDSHTTPQIKKRFYEDCDSKVNSGQLGKPGGFSI